MTTRTPTRLEVAACNTVAVVFMAALTVVDKIAAAMVEHRITRFANDSHFPMNEDDQ